MTTTTSGKQEFTREQVLEVAHKLVDEFGEDYIYPHEMCLYVMHGKPSCIVGHIVSRLEPEAFKALVEAEQTVGSISGLEIRRAVGMVKELAPFRAQLDLLENMQEHQDARETWGDAVAFAEDYG